VAAFSFVYHLKKIGMNDTIESGQDVELIGQSGSRYTGKIYAAKNSASSIAGRAIAVLSNSTYTDEGWVHHVNSIYNTDNIGEELAHFRQRDDISHLILLPYIDNDNGVQDKVDDLIRQYLHG
jgi:hypothetical protein